MAVNDALIALTLGLATLTQQAAQTVQSRPPAPHQQAASSNVLEEAEHLLNQQRFAEAAEKLNGLTSTYPNSAQLWFDLGFAQSHQGKIAEAVTAYRKAVDLAPSWFEANLNLGVALAKSGDNRTAASVLRHATELKPLAGGPAAVANAWESLGRVLEETDFRQAAAAYDKAAELNPRNPGLGIDAGRLF